MKILFVDTKHTENEDPLALWLILLREKGYTCKVVPVLEDLGEKDPLSNYDVAIAHPLPCDAYLLKEELRKRPDFRVLLNGGCGLRKGLDSDEAIELGRNTERCIYREFLGISELNSFLRTNL